MLRMTTDLNYNALSLIDIVTFFSSSLLASRLVSKVRRKSSLFASSKRKYSLFVNLIAFYVASPFLFYVKSCDFYFLDTAIFEIFCLIQQIL